jgi:hypothetical protein
MNKFSSFSFGQIINKMYDLLYFKFYVMFKWNMVWIE